MWFPGQEGGVEALLVPNLFLPFPKGLAEPRVTQSAEPAVTFLGEVAEGCNLNSALQTLGWRWERLCRASPESSPPGVVVKTHCFIKKKKINGGTLGSCVRLVGKPSGCSGVGRGAVTVHSPARVPAAFTWTRRGHLFSAMPEPSAPPQKVPRAPCRRFTIRYHA